MTSILYESRYTSENIAIAESVYYMCYFLSFYFTKPNPFPPPALANYKANYFGIITRTMANITGNKMSGNTFPETIRNNRLIEIWFDIDTMLWTVRQTSTVQNKSKKFKLFYPINVYIVCIPLQNIFVFTIYLIKLFLWILLRVKVKVFPGFMSDSERANSYIPTLRFSHVKYLYI